VLQPELTSVTPATSHTIPASLTTKHETWRCVVTPCDGELCGPPAAAEVQISNSPPVAVIQGPSSGIVDRAVQFDGTQSYDPDGDILTYSWEFGDWRRSIDPAPHYSYFFSDRFTATLIVSDSETQSEPIRHQIDIEPAENIPPPPTNDSDGDGVTDIEEIFLGTDPYKADINSDTRNDYPLPWTGCPDSQDPNKLLDRWYSLFGIAGYPDISECSAVLKDLGVQNIRFGIDPNSLFATYSDVLNNIPNQAYLKDISDHITWLIENNIGIIGFIGGGFYVSPGDVVEGNWLFYEGTRRLSLGESMQRWEDTVRQTAILFPQINIWLLICEAYNTGSVPFCLCDYPRDDRVPDIVPRINPAGQEPAQYDYTCHGCADERAIGLNKMIFAAKVLYHGNKGARDAIRQLGEAGLLDPRYSNKKIAIGIGVSPYASSRSSDKSPVNNLYEAIERLRSVEPSPYQDATSLDHFFDIWDIHFYMWIKDCSPIDVDMYMPSQGNFVSYFKDVERVIVDNELGKKAGGNEPLYPPRGGGRLNTIAAPIIISEMAASEGDIMVHTTLVDTIGGIDGVEIRRKAREWLEKVYNLLLDKRNGLDFIKMANWLWLYDTWYPEWIEKMEEVKSNPAFWIPKYRSEKRDAGVGWGLLTAPDYDPFGMPYKSPKEAYYSFGYPGDLSFSSRTSGRTVSVDYDLKSKYVNRDGPQRINADAYLVITTPGNLVYYVNSISPLKAVLNPANARPIISNGIISVPAQSGLVFHIPQNAINGIYALRGLICRPGTDPSNQINWITNLACTNFNITTGMRGRFAAQIGNNEIVINPPLLTLALNKSIFIGSDPFALSATLNPGDWEGTHLSAYSVIVYPDGSMKYIIGNNPACLEVSDTPIPFIYDFVMPAEPTSYNLISVPLPDSIPGGDYMIYGFFNAKDAEESIHNKPNQIPSFTGEEDPNRISNLASMSFHKIKKAELSLNTMNGSNFQRDQMVNLSYSVNAHDIAGQKVDLYLAVSGPRGNFYVTPDYRLNTEEKPFLNDVVLGDGSGTLSFIIPCAAPRGLYRIAAVITTPDAREIATHPCIWLSNVTTVEINKTDDAPARSTIQLSVPATHYTWGSTLQLNYTVDSCPHDGGRADLYFGVTGPGFTGYIQPDRTLSNSQTPFMSNFAMTSGAGSIATIIPSCIPSGAYTIGAVIVPHGESEIFNPDRQWSNLATVIFFQDTPRADRSTISLNITNGGSFDVNQTINLNYAISSCPHTGETVDLYLGIIGPGIGVYIVQSGSNFTVTGNETPFLNDFALYDSSGSISFTMTSAAPQGAYTIKSVLTKRDAINILQRPDTWLSNMAETGFSIKNSPPILTAGAPSRVEPGQTITLTLGVNKPVKRMQLLWDGEPFYDTGVFSPVSCGPFSRPFTVPEVIGGNHTLTFRAWDEAGQIGEASKVTYVYIDTIPPIIYVSMPESVSQGQWFGVSVSTDEDVRRVEIWFNGGCILGADTSGQGPWSVNVQAPGSSEGNYGLDFFARDKRGNVGHSYRTLFLDDVDPPDITSYRGPDCNQFYRGDSFGIMVCLNENINRIKLRVYGVLENEYAVSGRTCETTILTVPGNLGDGCYNGDITFMDTGNNWSSPAHFRFFVIPNSIGRCQYNLDGYCH